MADLDGRFKSLPEAAAVSTTQYSEGEAATEDIVLSKVNVPSKPDPGLTYRFKFAGTKTGTNAAMAVKLQLGATAVITLTAPGATAVDWVAEITLVFKSYNAQRVFGTLLTNAAAVVADYAAGTVDCSAGADLVAQMTCGHASDAITCEVATVEKWTKN